MKKFRIKWFYGCLINQLRISNPQFLIPNYPLLCELSVFSVFSVVQFLNSDVEMKL